MENNKMKDLSISEAELFTIGCKSCIWRLHNQCPHDILEGNTWEFVDGNGNKINGICVELLDFLSKFASGGESQSTFWERYHIYKAQLQETEDYKDFMKLTEEVKNLQKCAYSEDDRNKLEELRMNKTAAKMWWLRLNEHVIKSFSKVADREAKQNESVKLPGILSAKTINFNITKQIEDRHETN